jgi:hypothetical protein
MCPRCTTLAKADFDPFVWWDAGGRARFANRLRGKPWPVFRRVKRRRRKIFRSDTGHCWQMVNRSIIKSSDVAAARRWIPMNPLLAHQMRVEDAANPTVVA